MDRDADLLQRWRAGDRDAGAELFDDHYKSITRFFRSKVAVPPEDLVQKTFLGLLEGLSRFRGEGSFRSYLFSVAYNVLRNHFRSERRRPDIDFGVTSVADLGERLSIQLADGAERRALVAALQRIPLEHQVLLELYYDEELTAPEIAESMGIAEGTVRTRLRRAKQLLAERLEKVVAEPGLVGPALSLLEERGGRSGSR